MAFHSDVPSPTALYPLTDFDNIGSQSAYMAAVVVEGIVDVTVFCSALQRLTEKWRLLAGRLEHRHENARYHWRIRIPVGETLPHDYPTFILTDTVSKHPVTRYIPVGQVTTFCDYPPDLILLPPNVPTSSWEFQANYRPLTWWHITHFPANRGRSYSVIGFAWPHGVFDDVGVSLIVHRLVDEMHGRFEMPPLPNSGVQANELKEALKDMKVRARVKEYRHVEHLGKINMTRMVSRAIWEGQAGGARQRCLVLPKRFWNALWHEVTRDITSENITLGDVLTAWLWKAMYAVDDASGTVTSCISTSSIRSLLPASLATYPHHASDLHVNPSMSVEDLVLVPLRTLARYIARARLSVSVSHACKMYDALRRPPRGTVLSTVWPDPKAGYDDTFIITELTSVLEADWRIAGGIRAVCGFVKPIVKLPVTNWMCIVGQMEDGSVVLSVCLNRRRKKNLEAAVAHVLDHRTIPFMP